MSGDAALGRLVSRGPELAALRSALERARAGRASVVLVAGDAGVGKSRPVTYRLAATAFQSSGAQVDFEYLVKDVQGRLAYTVAIERASVLYTGRPEPQPQILRVTMLFRRDHGAWKIIHRHADTMVDLQLPQAQGAGRHPSEPGSGCLGNRRRSAGGAP